MLLTAIYIILGILFGFTCMNMAKSKGRDGAGWFLIGFFFGLLGVILIVVMPEIKKKNIYMAGRKRPIKKRKKKKSKRVGHNY